MARRSRRGKKSSRRNLYLSVAVIVVLVVAHSSRLRDREPRAGRQNEQQFADEQYFELVRSRGLRRTRHEPGHDSDSAIPAERAEDGRELRQPGQIRVSTTTWSGTESSRGSSYRRGTQTRGEPSSVESTWGQGGSGTTIPFENSGLPEGQYYVAMANTSPQGDGASSQFFINLVDNTSSLGSGYAVFGMVVQGMSVVQAIGALPVASSCASSSGLTCPPTNPSQALLTSVTIQSTP